MLYVLRGGDLVIDGNYASWPSLRLTGDASSLRLVDDAVRDVTEAFGFEHEKTYLTNLKALGPDILKLL